MKGRHAISADRRRELRAQYDERHTEPGVYVLRNTVTGRVLLASTVDLGSVRSRLEFAKATNTPSAVDGRLTADVREFGIVAFALEVLDLLEVTPGMTPADVQADLRTLEGLWREKLGRTPHY
jgi:hypothetical protein